MGNGNVYTYDSTRLAVYVGNQSAVSSVSSAHYALSNANLRIGFSASVPIVGWSSNTVMSDSASLGPVSLVATKNGGAFTASTAIGTWTTPVAKDSHGAFNASTGIYTVKVAGDYFVSFNGRLTAAAGGSAAVLKSFTTGRRTIRLQRNR